MRAHRVERVRPADVVAAGAALSLAFQEDPLVRFLAPDDEQRRRWLPALQGSHLRATLGDGHTYMVRHPGEGDVVAGAICLAPPGRYPPGPIRALAMFRGVMLDKSSPPPALRHLARGARYLVPIGLRHPRTPHWYVLIVGVRPASQGLGLGRALLDRAADLADTDRLPLYLETMTTKNVQLYESCGFEVVERFSPHPEGPDCWTMLRPARR